MKTISNLFLLLVILSVSLSSKAQFGYSKGYIITNAHDTIHGFISERGDIGNAAVCKFKESKKSVVKSFHPGEIVSYRFTDGKYYQSLEVTYKGKNITAFTEVLLDGDLTLYNYYKNSELQYYIKKSDGTVVGLPNEILTLRQKSHGIAPSPQVESFMIASYKDSLDMIFKNCSDLKQKVEELKYDTKPMVDVTKDYLNCTCNKENCIKYEKDLYRTRPTIGVYTGVQLSKIFILDSRIESAILTSVPIGLFYNLPISFINDRLSFQAEISYKRLNYNKGFYYMPLIYSDITISSNVINLPLSLKYSLPLKKFTPSIGIGKEFGYNFNTQANTVPDEFSPENWEKEMRKEGFFIHYYERGGWFADLGLDYRLTKKLSIYSALRFSTYLNLIIEEKNYNNFLFKVAEGKNGLVNPHSNVYRTYAGALYLGIRF